MVKHKDLHLMDWWKWWYERRAHIQEIFRPTGAPRTNNVIETQHNVWDIAGATQLTMPELCIFDLVESLLTEAYQRSMLSIVQHTFITSFPNTIFSVLKECLIS